MGASSSDSAYILAIIAANDSLFHGGTGSPLVLVPNQINITSYHQQNYDPLVGFPGELGYNVIFGGGNNTTNIHSTTASGGYILGGTIHITGSIEAGLKETKGRVKGYGDTDAPGMMWTTTTSNPNLTERAYDKTSDINNAARIDTNYEIFSLEGLTTTSSAPSKPAPIKPLVKDDSFIE